MDWKQATILTLLLYFLILIVFSISISWYESKRRDSLYDSPIGIYKDIFNVEERWNQLFKVFFVTGLGLSVVLALSVYGVQGIIVGSLLGVLPPLLLQMNESWRKPSIHIIGVRAVKYPKKVYVIGNRKDEKEPANAIGLHVTIKNDGRTTAKGCKVRLVSDLGETTRYPTRWSSGNRETYDLAPGEEADVDLLWVGLRTYGVESPTPFRDDDESDEPPGNYETEPRHELEGREHRLSIEADAENMRPVTRRVSIHDEWKTHIPNDIVNSTQEWEYLSLLKKGREDCVVYYDERSGEQVEMPLTQDLAILRNFEEFKPENINVRSSETYEEALQRVLDISTY